jgi:SPP1 gp7 family putative phage head morphogenesis protein
MRQFKLDLLARETRQMGTMARRWLQVERALEGNITALAEQMARIRADGGTVTREMLFSMDRYHALLAQLRVEVGQYSAYAAELIETEQLRHGRLGIQHAARAIELAGPASLRGAFDILPVDAIEFMAGHVADGTPLRLYLEQTWGDAALGMTDELLRATALGINPRQTAKRMQDGTTRSLNRMLNTARTEQLRVYRASNREQMRASGVVTGYRRLATHDSRVCAACLMDEGHLYRLDETMPEHNQGRCAQIPVVEGMPELTWQRGADWLLAQNAKTQQNILGAGRYAAFRAGQFDLDSLVTVQPDPTWGDRLQVTPLQQLVA